MLTVYRYWGSLVLLLIVLQVGFAGYGAFDVAKQTDGGTVDEDFFEDAFGLHAGVGYLVVLVMLLFLIIALVARPGRQRVTRVGILFGLGILQVLLAWFGFEAPVIGFFHPVNALVLTGLSGWLVWDAWRGGVGPVGTPAV